MLTLVQQEVYDLSRGSQLPYVESGLPQLFFASSKREDLPERERLLLAMADVTPDLRAEVEQIAAAEQMPLAPLYGALISADLANTTIEARRVKLTEAAKAFASQRDELRTLSNADPEVTRLRQAAEDQLALGAYETARALHEQAIALDRRSAAMLDARARERHLSEAATHSLKGGMARATLRYGDAITDYQNAAAIYDRYDNEDMPEDDRQRQLLALEALGNIETTVGNLAAAESAFGRLLRGDLARVAKDPANLDWQHFLAVGYVATGDLQVAQGNIAGALASYRQALAIAQQRLVAADPANEKWQRDLSVGQSKIGNMLVIQGDLRGALEAYQASLDILAKLADAAPDNIEWTRDFSVALDRIGEVLMQQGRLSGAFEAYQASLTIRHRLAASDPGNFARMLDLSVSQEKVGDVLMARGNAADALATYETSSVIAEHLSGSDPANTDWQRGLSIIQGKRGQALMALGDLSGALDAHRSALVISQRLAAADPGNLRWQRDLSVIYDDISAVRLKQGNLAEAMENCRASLGIWQRLVASDPGNAGWQRDLSISHDRIGDVLVAQGDRPGALAEYETSLALRERLVASDPGNAIWLHDLIVSHVQIAQSGSDKAGHLQAALEIASAMEKNGTLAPSDANLPGLLLEELAKAQNAAR